jgi:hypothetical protein
MEYDEQREDYASLADEMNDEDVGPWNEKDWDPRAVKNAKAYAKRVGLNWPPRTGDYDRLYDIEHNPSDYPDIKL